MNICSDFHLGRHFFGLTPGHYRLCKPIASKTLSDDFFIRSGVKFPTEIYR